MQLTQDKAWKSQRWARPWEIKKCYVSFTAPAIKRTNVRKRSPVDWIGC